MIDVADADAEGLPRLGRYELRRRLARGGMAELWLADARGLSGFGRRIAIKRILPELGKDEELVERFLAEARLAARLHHRGIVQVFEVGCEDGDYFYAMEFLDGLDLRQVMENASLPLEAAVWIVAEVADALHEAHECAHEDGSPLGLVHRDVKPSNLFVTWDGVVKVLDFGIARVRADLAASKTRTGVLRGTYAYMSPEQVRSLDLDRRSDIFSLGIVMFELVTRTRLFQRSAEFETLQAIVAGDVPRPCKRAPGCPPALDAIIVKALGRRPEDRFATAANLASELREVVTSTLRPWSSPSMAAWMSSNRPAIAEASAEASAERATGPSISATLTEDERASRGARWSWLVWLVVAAAGAAGLFWLARDRDTAEPEPAAAAIAPTPVADPAPGPEVTSQVRVALEIDPSTAVVEMDGRAVNDNPFVLPAGTQPRSLVIRAAGYRDRNIAITPTRDQTLVVALDRVPPVEPTPTARRRSGKRDGKRRAAASEPRQPDLDRLLIRGPGK